MFSSIAFNRLEGFFLHSVKISKLLGIVRGFRHVETNVNYVTLFKYLYLIDEMSAKNEQWRSIFVGTNASLKLDLTQLMIDPTMLTPLFSFSFILKLLWIDFFSSDIKVQKCLHFFNTFIFIFHFRAPEMHLFWKKNISKN